VTREDLNYLTSSSKLRPPFVIVEAPETTKVEYFIPKMANTKTSSKRKKKEEDIFMDHVNEYRIIIESKQLLKMFMAEENNSN
jgi:hypothetical protein